MVRSERPVRQKESAAAEGLMGSEYGRRDFASMVPGFPLPGAILLDGPLFQ